MSTVDENAAVSLETASEVVWQREEARRALLANFGVVSLISRYDPVGAMPANRFAAPILEGVSEARSAGGKVRGAEQGEPPAVARKPSAASKGHPQGSDDTAALKGNTVNNIEAEMQGEQLRALLRDEGGTTPPLVGDGPDASQRHSGDAIKKRSDQRLSLLIVVTDDVLWIEQLDDHLLRKEQLQLVVAMARAIRGSTVNCEHQQFEWPPAGGLTFSQEDGLTAMLSGFLQRMVTDHRSQLVIQLGSVDVLPSLPLAVHRVPSSLTMLQDPLTKRQAWSTLKSLVIAG